MSPKKRILLALCLAVAMISLALVGTALYIYNNPSSIKGLLESSLSQFTGGSFSIKSLHYSLRPLSVRAEGLTLQPGSTTQGLHMEIPLIEAGMTTQGSFGQKTLLIETIKVHEPRLQIEEAAILPNLKPEVRGPSSLSRLLMGGFALLFFRDIKLKAAEMVNGTVTSQLADQTIQLQDINVQYAPEQQIEITCKGHAQWPEKDLKLIAHQIEITTAAGLSLTRGKTGASLNIRKMKLQSTKADVDNIHLKANLIYDHEAGVMGFENLETNILGLNPRINDKAQVPPLDIHIRTRGFFNLNERRLNAPEILLTMSSRHQKDSNKILHANASFDMGFKPSEILKAGLKDVRIFPQGLPPYVQEIGLSVPSGLDISGPVNLKGTFEGLGSPKGWNWKCDLQAQTKDNELSYKDGGITIGGKLSYSVKAQGSFPNVLLSGNIKGDQIDIHHKGLTLAPFRATAAFSGIHPIYRIEKSLFDLPMARIMAGNQEIHIKDAETRFLNGELDVAQMSLDLSTVEVISDLNVKGERFSLSAERVDLATTGFRLNQSDGRIDTLLTEMSTLIPQGRVMAMGKEILIKDIKTDWHNILFMSGDDLTLEIPEFRFHSDLIRNLKASLSMNKAKTIMTLQGKDIGLIDTAKRLDLIPKGWQLSGEDSLNASISLGADTIPEFDVSLGLDKIALQNQEGNWMGEKISLIARAAGDVTLKDFSASTRASLEVKGGEMLYEEFYFDFGKNNLSSIYQGTYRASDKMIEIADLKVAMEEILSVNLSGTASLDSPHPAIDFDLQIPPIPLKPGYRQFVVEPFQTKQPFLAKMEVDGKISSNLKLTGRGNDWNIKGRFKLSEGKLESIERGIDLQGIDLDLPVWYQAPKSSKKSQMIEGKLDIQGIYLPIIGEQSISLPLVAGPNTYSVPSPTVLKFHGGRVVLDPITFLDVFEPNRSITTSLKFDEISVSPLLSEVWKRPIEGSIGGALEPIRFSGNAFKSEGDIQIRAFGGSITISDLGASGIFTSAPVLRLNATFDDLTLADITTDTSFGRIEGILSGHANDLHIAYGQPQSFDLLMETVKKRGVSQRISVKAIDNIARIGGGQSPFMGLAGAFATLFREFPYKKIGVHASLENDLFKINGTIKEGGQEYLVKRSGISGVDVVNQNPDNRIRFKDMVKRIMRVTSSKSGPVVK